MKQIRLSLLLLALLLTSSICRTQNFSVSCPDSIAWGPAIDSTTLSLWNDDYVTNLTESPLVLDVVRVQNDTATPGWGSSFCFQFCSLPNVDSIRATLQPNEAVNIAMHFHVTSVPDSGSVLMKYQNVNNPTEVIYQRFYAFTSPVSVGPAISTSSGQVTTYPAPAVSQQDFTMNLEGEKFAGENMTLEVYDVYGRKVASETGLHEGANNVNLDVAAGVYTYSISSDNVVVHSGMLVFSL